MGFILRPQNVQLVFDNVLTLCNAEEAIALPWNNTNKQTHNQL